MKIRVKVYDKNGEVYNRLDLAVLDDESMPDTVNDIEDFLMEQYIELTEEDEE